VSVELALKVVSAVSESAFGQVFFRIVEERPELQDGARSELQSRLALAPVVILRCWRKRTSYSEIASRS